MEGAGAEYIPCVYTGAMMKTRVFQSGNSQAVRIPRQFQFQSATVEIFRRGDEIVLREPERNLKGAFELLAQLGDLFPQGRPQPKTQKRPRL